MPGVIVDIGTGDGSFAYEVAKANPDRFVIGIDPNREGPIEKSRKIYKKPEKGGLKNALFVLSSIQELSHELDGIADQVFINFPWSGLLRGIVLVDKEVWSSIRRICKNGAIVDILLSEPDESQLRQMKEKLAEKGFEISQAKEIGNEELKEYPSTWAKRFSFGKKKKFYYLRALAK